MELYKSELKNNWVAPNQMTDGQIGIIRDGFNSCYIGKLIQKHGMELITLGETINKSFPAAGTNSSGLIEVLTKDQWQKEVLTILEGCKEKDNLVTPSEMNNGDVGIVRKDNEYPGTIGRLVMKSEQELLVDLTGGSSWRDMKYIDCRGMRIEILPKGTLIKT